jgi:hypothetical protein
MGLQISDCGFRILSRAIFRPRSVESGIDNLLLPPQQNLWVIPARVSCQVYDRVQLQQP